jgi:hypothetical protein
VRSCHLCLHLWRCPNNSYYWQYTNAYRPTPPWSKHGATMIETWPKHGPNTHTRARSAASACPGTHAGPSARATARAHMPSRALLLGRPHTRPRSYPGTRTRADARARTRARARARASARARPLGGLTFACWWHQFTKLHRLDKWEATIHTYIHTYIHVHIYTYRLANIPGNTYL